MSSGAGDWRIINLLSLLPINIKIEVLARTSKKTYTINNNKFYNEDAFVVLEYIFVIAPL